MDDLNTRGQYFTVVTRMSLCKSDGLKKMSYVHLVFPPVLHIMHLVLGVIVNLDFHKPQAFLKEPFCSVELNLPELIFTLSGTVPRTAVSLAGRAEWLSLSNT